jgi:hypothetical protein
MMQRSNKARKYNKNYEQPYYFSCTQARQFEAGHGNKIHPKAEAALRTEILLKSVTKIVIRRPAKLCTICVTADINWA